MPRALPEAIGALAGWLKEGKLKQKSEIGLENAKNTIVRLFTGQNSGKQLLNIADPPSSTNEIEDYTQNTKSSLLMLVVERSPHSKLGFVGRATYPEPD